MDALLKRITNAIFFSAFNFYLLSLLLLYFCLINAIRKLKVDRTVIKVDRTVGKLTMKYFSHRRCSVKKRMS